MGTLGTVGPGKSGTVTKPKVKLRPPGSIEETKEMVKRIFMKALYENDLDEIIDTTAVTTKI
jgi:hypothetical protein